MVRVDDYAELAAIVAEREERRDLEVAGETLRGGTPMDEAGEQASRPVFAPLLSARTAAVAAAVGLLVTWEDADLRQLAVDNRPAARAWAYGLDVCASRPGHPVSESELVAGAGSKVAQRIQDPAALDRLLIRSYGGLGRPVRLISGAQLGHHDDQQYWVVSQEQARAWLAARGA